MPGARPIDPTEPWGPTYIPVLKMPDWLKNLVTPKNALDQCEQDADEALDRGYLRHKTRRGQHGPSPTARVLLDASFDTRQQRARSR